MTSHTLLLTLTFGVIALLGTFLLVHDGITGNATRRSPTVVYELPYCPTGCAYGDVMTLKTKNGNVLFSANDIVPQNCHPPTERCLPEHYTIYTATFKGKPIPGGITCIEHHWEHTLAGLSVPCPPTLPKS